MNAKHLFLTLVAAVSCATYVSAATATDVINVSTIKAKGYASSLTDGDCTSASGWTFSSSGVTYGAGSFCYSDGGNFIGLGDNYSFSSTASVSGRTVKSITIEWEDTPLNSDGMNATLTIYARNTPYTGAEYGLGALGDDLHTFTYGESGTTYNFTSEYKYVALGARGENGAFLKSISIEWEWEEYTYYTIEEGSITGDGHSWGVAVVPSTTSAKEGDIVTITFAPQLVGSGFSKKKYSLTSYGFDGMVFDLSCTTYPTNPNTYTVKFPMPARNVRIDAKFEKVTFITAKVAINKSVTNVQSGVEKVIAFTHLDQSKNPIADYTAEYMTATSSKPSVLTVDAPVKVSDGNYTFTVHGLAMGEATVTISAAAKGTIDYAEDDITFTVTPREVVLLAERSGSYYVMENTLDGHTAPAHEVVFNTTDSKYYYDDAVSLSDVTWNATTVTEGEYAIQNPNDNEYLKFDKGNITMSASTYSWWKNGEQKFQSSDAYAYGIVTNGTSFLASADLTNAAIEALVGTNFIPFGSYSTVSGAAINDPRTLTEGNYGTFCSPYDVPSVAGVGAKFFTLEGKVVSGENLAGIVISDPVDELVAGHAYLYQVDEGSDAINLERCMRHLTKASTSTEDGFVGCLADDNGGAGKVYATAGVSPRSNGDYILKDNKLHYVPTGATGSARTYRAFIRAKELTEVKAGSVPKRRIVIVDGFTGEIGSEDSETSVDELVDSSELNWDKPVYNIMGVRVSKGATGVLIQNGHKFFVK